MLMDAKLIMNPKMLRKYNFMRYQGVPPSQELIEKVVKKSGLKFFARFEVVWAMPKDVLTLVKNGHRNLPAKYWHIFYEFDAVYQIYSNSYKKSKLLPKKHSILPSNKTSLNDFKQRQSTAK